MTISIYISRVRHFSKCIVFIGFIVSSVFCGIAQNAVDALDIEYITTDEGLSQNEVTAVLQDKKGFLWIGTRGGLNRYDGNEIRVFQNEIGNPNSLVNNSVECLFEDSNGYIWIGTKSGGISKYHPKFDQFEKLDSLQNTLSNKNVISIKESATNEIWIGTRKNGLYIYNQDKNSIRKPSQGSLSAVPAIIKTRDHKMWVGTANGFLIFDKQGEIIEQVNNPDRSIVSYIVEDKKSGIIYYASWGSGLYQYNPHTKEFKKIELIKNDSKVAVNAKVHFVFIDIKNNLWAGSWGNGVYRYDLETHKSTHFSLHTNTAKGSDELYNDVLFIFQDTANSLWFGTNGGGVCKIADEEHQFGFSSYNSGAYNLPKEPIWSIFKDNRNTLFVGIKGNENIYYKNENNPFETLTIPKAFPNGNRDVKEGAKVIYQDLDDHLWVGGHFSLFKMIKSKSSYEIISDNIELNYDNERITRTDRKLKVSTLAQTRDGTFWIGSQQRGLRKSIAPGNPLNQKFERHLEKDRISAFLEDRSGNIWVGTYSGIQRYQTKTNDFKRYHKNLTSKGSLSSDIIICIYEDSKGNIWVGTPNGLNKLIQKDGDVHFESYQLKDGLPNNYIHSILEDSNNNLWLSTNKGISKFSVSDNSFYNFDINDGLQSNSFMEASHFKDKSGILYFGGIYGLNNFHPDSINKKSPPSVILTELKIAGQPIKPKEKYNERVILKKAIEYSKKITLSHDENIFSIGFSSLDYSNGSNSYKIKLEPLEKDWQVSTSQTNITYSNLKPGNYEFKVKSVNDSMLVENPDTFTSLKITILPPFWKTWPAFALYTILFIGLLLLYGYFITQKNNLKNKLQIARFERNKEEELAKLKTQFFTDIAHEFRTPLSLIVGPVETLIENDLSQEEQKSQLTTIQYHTKRLLHLISQLLDFRKAESGNMVLQVAKGNFEKFTSEIFLSFRELAQSKEIDFNLDINPPTIPLTYDRVKMEIVLCNLLSNAFKYTNSKIQVSVSLHEDDKLTASKFPEGYCKISIKDNGQGMPKDMVKKIFDRFYQLTHLNSSNLIGTGIGLSLTKNIVELHKGEINVESEINIGSNFVVKLPLGESHFSREQFIKDFKKSEDPIHYQVERVTPISDSKLSIKESDNIPTLLIVEDNTEIRTFIKSIFKVDFKIIEASNGKIGLQKAEEHLPSAIITDLMMPIMDGLTLCNTIRGNENLLHIPIVMLTARTTNVFQEKGYNSGADIYITKPFNPALLKTQVEGLIKSRRQLKEYFSNSINLIQSKAKVNSVDEVFINKLMQLVEDNLTNEKLNREFLASNMAMSASTLYRKVKGLTGIDITEFIRSIRLKRAAQMILNKEDTISGIAYAVGFNDPKYFRKCFVKQFGVNPSQYGKDQK